MGMRGRPGSTGHTCVWGQGAEGGSNAYRAPEAPCGQEPQTPVMVRLGQPVPPVGWAKWALWEFISKELEELPKIAIEQEQRMAAKALSHGIKEAKV